MLFCPKCGSRYSDESDTLFCRRDGTALKTLAEEGERDSGGSQGEPRANNTTLIVAADDEKLEAIPLDMTGDKASKAMCGNPDEQARFSKDSVYGHIVKGEFLDAKIKLDDAGLYLLESDGAIGLHFDEQNVIGYYDLGAAANSDGRDEIVLRWFRGDMSLCTLDRRLLDVLGCECEENSSLRREDVMNPDDEGIAGIVKMGSRLSIILILMVSLACNQENAFMAILIGAFVWAMIIAAASMYLESAIKDHKSETESKYFTERERAERQRQRSRRSSKLDAEYKERAERKRRVKEAEKKRQRAEKQIRDAEIAKNLKCPICGSHDVKRIDGSMTLRASTARKQMGKQYQCNYCKHMW